MTTDQNTACLAIANSTPSDPPTWEGYDGNQVVYLTSGDDVLTSGNSWIPSPSYSNWGYASAHQVADNGFNGPGSYYNVPLNAVSVGVGGTLSSGSNVGQNFEQY